MMGKPAVEFFFSFRSPYSYLAAPRAFALPHRFDIELVYRGVRPMVTRGVPLPFAKKLYIVWDARREAKRLRMPFGRIYDPLGVGALRCLYIAELAGTMGIAREFVLRASRAIWAEGVRVASDTGMRPLCEEVGIPWQDCLAAMEDPIVSARIEENNARLRTIGHWGVPAFAFDGQVFWGQDRMVDLEMALRDKGIAERKHGGLTSP
jgi:2-hydroxychromene-2-carboxylate isomerase